MCGIIGYIGDKKAAPILIEGLKKMEYRGYDSVGFCVQENGVLSTIKRKGKVGQLDESSNNFLGTSGIAHTRWATHGKPNEINAHPHFSCNKNIAVVHNGIIENYQSLKQLLIKEGHIFVSETDSEVLAHLIEKFFRGNLEDATSQALRLVEGAYGLLVLHAENGELVVAKKSSPLIIGIGSGEMFVASDISAILAHTKKAVYLDDGDIATVTSSGYFVKNKKGIKVSKEVHIVSLTIDQIEKNDFKHFMLKEIFEQPEAITNTLRGRLVKNKVVLGIGNFKKVKRIIITACGTSWHSALIGKYIIEKIARVSVEVDYASEFRYRSPIILPTDLVIVISQSGETADTLAALLEAKRNKAKTLGIINVVGSTIAREVDSGMYLHAGPEIGVASTKAFVCQVMALTLFACHIQPKNKKIIAELPKIAQKIREALQKSTEIRKIAEVFKNSKHFLYLGRNVNFPVALEGALKLKEISYIHAEGYPAAEMKHGPIALIDEKMPVVFLAPHDQTYLKIVSNMEEIKARGGKIIAIVNHDDEKIKHLADYVIKVPKTIDDLSMLINVIPLQLLAYHIADLKGLNVDRPRNLAKSVTVE